MPEFFHPCHLGEVAISEDAKGRRVERWYPIPRELDSPESIVSFQRDSVYMAKIRQPQNFGHMLCVREYIW